MTHHYILTRMAKKKIGITPNVDEDTEDMLCNKRSHHNEKSTHHNKE